MHRHRYIGRMIRLVSFRSIESKKMPVQVGAFIGGDLSNVINITKAMNIPSMQQFINNGADNLRAFEEIVAVDKSLEKFSIPSAGIQLLAPIPEPKRNIFCIGKNYKDHIAEVAKANTKTAQSESDKAAATQMSKTPEMPIFFTKAPQCVIGDNERIQSHVGLTKWLDYEAELAVIIGKKGRDISLEDSLNHVFGYSIGNDITARDLQKRYNQWFKGKSLDTSCPMGPYIVPSSYIADPFNLNVKLWVNDEERQNSNTNNMIFDIKQIIHHLSQGMTLYPGDIILTGTPDGVGFAMDPPRMLKAGDVVKIEIENLGKLTNSVTDDIDS